VEVNVCATGLIIQFDMSNNKLSKIEEQFLEYIENGDLRPDFILSQFDLFQILDNLNPEILDIMCNFLINMTDLD
jgi:hypothetical protein